MTNPPHLTVMFVCAPTAASSKRPGLVNVLIQHHGGNPQARSSAGVCLLRVMGVLGMEKMWCHQFTSLVCHAIHASASSFFVPVACLPSLVACRLLPVPPSTPLTPCGQETPLHWAAKSGATACAMVLLRHGASCHAQDSQGRTCAHVAAGQGHIAVLQALHCAVTAALPQQQQQQQQTVSAPSIATTPHSADHSTSTSHRSSVRPAQQQHRPHADADATPHLPPLCGGGASSSTLQPQGRAPLLWLARDNSGKTPVHWAAYFGRALAAEWMLHHGGGGATSAMDDRGRTPLHWAAWRGHLACVEALVRLEQAGVESVNDGLLVGESAGAGASAGVTSVRQANVPSGVFRTDGDGKTPRALALQAVRPGGAMFVRMRSAQA